MEQSKRADVCVADCETMNTHTSTYDLQVLIWTSVTGPAPKDTSSCLPLFKVRVVDSDASDQSGAEHTQAYGQSASYGECPSNATKAKFEAAPDMVELTIQDTEDDQEPGLHRQYLSLIIRRL